MTPFVYTVGGDFQAEAGTHTHTHVHAQTHTHTHTLCRSERSAKLFIDHSISSLRPGFFSYSGTNTNTNTHTRAPARARPESGHGRVIITQRSDG